MVQMLTTMCCNNIFESQNFVVKGVFVEAKTPIKHSKIGIIVHEENNSQIQVAEL